MSQKVEIYQGELTLACHQITQQFAKKLGLNYSNAEGHCLPFLEQMASSMAEALQDCNPDKEIVVINTLRSPEEIERRNKVRREIEYPRTFDAPDLINEPIYPKDCFPKTAFNKIEAQIPPGSDRSDEAPRG